mgnify:FL=1
MDLQENIGRIKQVMGINESSIAPLKRRMDELPEYIKSALYWLNPTAFNSLEEFIKRVAFSTTRDFVADKFSFKSQEEYDQMSEETYPHILQYIEENFMEEIRDYYDEKRP